MGRIRAHLGLGKPSGRNFAFQASGGSATYSQVDNVGDGLAGSGKTHNGTFLYDRDAHDRSSTGRPNSIRLSGRYRHDGKVTDLAPGTYRLTALAKTGAGTGPLRRTTFTVLPPT